MSTAVIVAAVRTPFGRSHPTKGVFRAVRGDDLAVACVQAIVERTRIAPTEIDDVILGATQQTGEQGANVARQVALLAGLPASTAAVTVNRLCGSGLESLRQATHAIVAGEADVQIAGGLEHMHHLPIGASIDLNPRLAHVMSRAAFQMGLTAEYLARKFGIGRERQDEFALRSHERAAAAYATGAIQSQLVAVEGLDDSGRRVLVERDPCVRADANRAALAALAPAFAPTDGTVTAGNSSPLNDGAAALLVMSAEKAHSLGLRPLASVRATAVVGVEPSVMGLGPVPATQRVLSRTGLALSQIDWIEINEAFAAQILACLESLGLTGGDLERVNPLGGALAIGHPLGASGARLVANTVHALDQRQLRYGLVAMCIGMGQGIAMILERWNG